MAVFGKQGLAPRCVVQFLEQQGQKVKMVVLVLRGKADDAADFFAALHRDGVLEQGERSGTGEDAVFCLGMCEQETFAEDHVIAVAGQQCDDAVDVALDDKMALQERLACVLDGILPDGPCLMRRGRNLAAAVGCVLQQGVRRTLPAVDFHLVILPVEVVVQSLQQAVHVFNLCIV